MGSWIQVAATVILVIITGYYAAQTKKMVSEMAAARREQETARRAEQSDAAVARMLAHLALRDDEASRHGWAWLTGQRCIELRIDVRRESWGIQDDEVRERADACAAAALSLVKDTHAFTDGSRDLATIHLQMLVARARQTLEQHLARRPLPTWDDLPRRVEAQAWIINKAQGR
jgi:hypothetical protein